MMQRRSIVAGKCYRPGRDLQVVAFDRNGEQCVLYLRKSTATSLKESILRVDANSPFLTKINGGLRYRVRMGPVWHNSVLETAC